MARGPQQKPDSTDIEAQRRAVEVCEKRFALSASMAADFVVDALNLGEDLDSVNDDTPNLLSQSEALRTDFGLDGSGQTVAVIDSGVAYDHIALGEGFGPGYRVVGGWDFAEEDANPYDDGPSGYHGTHVAGLLAGQSDDFSGVAPGADIVSLRVFDDAGNGQLEWIESALQWVYQNQDNFDSPITTVNLSIGAALDDANRDYAMGMLEDELSLLRDSDILVFAATGNSFDGDSSSILYPASSESVVAVGSIDPSGQLSEFSQRESEMFAALGENVVSAVPDHVFGWDGNVDDMASLHGTSMATPQIAAASMLVRQAMISEGLDPSAEDILERLHQSAAEQTDPSTGATYLNVDLETALDGLISSNDSGSGSSTDGVVGTDEGDHVVLDLRDGIHVTIGGNTYQLQPEPGGPLVIDVGGGGDSLEIFGGEQIERLTARNVEDGPSRLATNEFEIELRGFERMTFDGGGGNDVANLYDSPRNDQLDSRPANARLKGIGFQFDVINVPQIFVHADAGGDDTAFLHDSEQDDRLSVRPDFTSLRNDETFQLAYNFETVYAYAGSGGTDFAKLYDSEGDDTLNLSSDLAQITGPGYQVNARGFDITEAEASSGGSDVARIYADQDSNSWSRTADKVQLTNSENDVRIARRFERTEAFENFAPVELTTQSLANDAWAIDDEELREREADAARAIFEALGKDN